MDCSIAFSGRHKEKRMAGRKMKVLVTGANGFIGKNLVAELQYKENVEILSCIAENVSLFLILQG